MKKLILLFTMALMMQSCIVIKMPTFGDLYVMGLTPEEKNNVYWTSDTTSLIGLTNDGRIYAVNPNQISDLLNTKEKAIVYRWLPYNMKEYVPIIFSQSYYDRKERKNDDDCQRISLDFLQSYCDENNIELYVVTNEYAAAFTEIDNITNPMFSMSIDSYIKDVSEKFEDQFYKELIGNKYDKDEFIYYFENGKFIETHDEIVNVKWENKWN